MIFFIFTNKTVSDMMIKDNFIDMICHAILSLESMKAHKKLKHFNTLVKLAYSLNAFSGLCPICSFTRSHFAKVNR